MLKQVLDQYGRLGVEALKEDIAGLSTTNKTAESIRYEITEKDEVVRLQILARAYFSTLETGRGPRKSSTDGGFKDNLTEYLDAKGFVTKTSKSGIKYYKIGDNWYSAKSLAWKINKEGDKTYRSGGRVVYSPTITKLAQEIITAVKRDFIQSTITRIRNVSKRSPTATGGNSG